MTLELRVRDIRTLSCLQTGIAMHNYYEDILNRIDEAPAWFDDFGVPRYEVFSPRRLSNIYANEAALAEVSCQCCGRLFRVALTNVFANKGFALSDEIRLRRVHDGDPPNVQCCGAGPSMNSVMRKIVEYWFRDYEVAWDWQRDSTFEGSIAERWLDPPDTAAEVLAAIQSGAKALVVMCTSRQTRYELAGKLSAAMSGEGRVLVVYPDSYSVVTRKMLDSFLSDADVGHWKEGRKVTLSSFSRLKETDLATIKAVAILAGPSPRNEIEKKNWSDASGRLTTGLSERISIEFALSHSCRMIMNPDGFVHAGRKGES